MNQRYSQKISLVNVDMVGYVTQDKNGTMLKKPLIHRACEVDYFWNPTTCACVWQRFLYWKTVNRWSLVDDLMVTCGEITDTPKNTPGNCTDGTTYWCIPVVLLASACLH